MTKIQNTHGNYEFIVNTDMFSGFCFFFNLAFHSWFNSSLKKKKKNTSNLFVSTWGCKIGLDLNLLTDCVNKPLSKQLM